MSIVDISTDYAEFLASKEIRVPSVGKQPSEVNPMLYPFQRDVVRWGVRKGRCAFFLHLGLGKTFAQLEWARLLDVPTLIIAPIEVCFQTVEEAVKLGITISYARDESDLVPGQKIHITNYERADRFNPDLFQAVVLDESSSLKSLDSKRRIAMTSQWKNTPYRLACSATPAPNDLKEIVNHAEFLGIMSRKEVFATFFINEDTKKKKKGAFTTRLKKHAVKPFYGWMSGWGMAARKPSDLGEYSDEGYILPPVTVHLHPVKSGYVPDGQLIFTKLKGVQDRSKVYRETLEERMAQTVQIVNADTDQWIVWHHLNKEGHLLVKQIPGSALIEGTTSPEARADIFRRFKSGEIRVLVTKPSIAGKGMNLQNCHKQCFAGINDSYEDYAQAIGRSQRHGQQHPVEIHICYADVQEGVLENVQRKAREADKMTDQLIEQTQAGNQAELQAQKTQESYTRKESKGRYWRLRLGDSADAGTWEGIQDNSIGLFHSSPPFVARYTYSATPRDLGNSRNMAEFMKHFDFVIRQMHRTLMPGRNVALHLQQVRVTKRDTGNVAMLDFRGACINAFQEAGFVYYSDYTIDKDAQIQAKRKHHQSLLYKSLYKDSSVSGSALADYLLIFKKPGENPHPIPGDLSKSVWNEIARAVWKDNIDMEEQAVYPISQLEAMSKGDLINMIQSMAPVWYGIDETKVLNSQIKGNDELAHLCPLQLPLVERCIRLWSNPGEIVADPFSGIATVGAKALEMGREYLGIELKESYFNTAAKNLDEAEIMRLSPTLWDYAEAQPA